MYWVAFSMTESYDWPMIAIMKFKRTIKMNHWLVNQVTQINPTMNPRIVVGASPAESIQKL